MRITSLIIACIVFITASCKKTNAVLGPDDLKGTWELRQTGAAMMPAPTNYPAGNGNTMSFTDSTYTFKNNGQTIKSGTYKIVPDATVEASVCLVIPAGQFVNRIIYDNNTTADKQFFQFINGRLHLIAGCYALDGGHSEVYERVN